MTIAPTRVGLCVDPCRDLSFYALFRADRAFENIKNFAAEEGDILCIAATSSQSTMSDRMRTMSSKGQQAL